MLSCLRDLLRTLPGRGRSPLACVGLYALFVATLTGWTAFVAGRWGSPLRGPLAHRLGLASIGVGGSLAWCWINGSVEGRILVRLSHNHAITSGDLLVVPALAFATSLVAAEAAPRLRRAI
jgi:hypothetical protein